MYALLTYQNHPHKNVKLKVGQGDIYISSGFICLSF